MAYADGPLSKGKETFLNFLRDGLTPEEAAEKAKISPRSFYNYMATPEIRREYDRIELARLGEVVRRGTTWALKRIQDPKAPDSIKRDIWREANRLYYGDAGGAQEAAKDPAEMSAAELQGEVKRLVKMRDKQLGKARDVTPATPEDGIEDAETIEESSPFD